MRNQLPFNTTICASTSSVSSSSSKIEHATSKSARRAPVFASEYRSSGGYFNLSAGGRHEGLVKTWYKYTDTVKALRMDFPRCPFLMLYEAGLDANFVPCSTLYWNGSLVYVYPSANVSCGYAMDVWAPDFMCASNVSYQGDYVIRGRKTELWSLAWISHFGPTWSQFSMRSFYMATGTNEAVRVREDLDMGYVDYDEYSEEHVDDSVFLDLLNAYDIHPGYNPNSSTSDRTCITSMIATIATLWP